MDLVWNLGGIFLALSVVVVMLIATTERNEQVDKTRDYINEQQESVAYSKRYAALSSFDADTAGKLSVQEVVNLIFSYATDDSPIIVRGPDNVLHLYVTDKGKWTFSSYGKPLGRKINTSGTYYDGTYNTNVGTVEKATEPLPAYKDLYNYLSNNNNPNTYYYANIDPDNSMSLRLILFVHTN